MFAYDVVSRALMYACLRLWMLDAQLATRVVGAGTSVDKEYWKSRAASNYPCIFLESDPCQRRATDSCNRRRASHTDGYNHTDRNISNHKNLRNNLLRQCPQTMNKSACVFIYTGLFKMTVEVLTTCHTQYNSDSSICIFFYLIEQHFKFFLHTLQVLYMCTLCDSTGLFEMIVGVLTTCHTQYTWDSSVCSFLFNRTTLQVFVTYLTGGLYVHPLWFYRVIRNDCRGFNNLSYTIHLR